MIGFCHYKAARFFCQAFFWGNLLFRCFFLIGEQKRADNKAGQEGDTV
jgi:hypothetical protein